MDEKLLYPAVALLYFAALSWESRGNRLILGTAASLNVVCLFLFAQPFCLSLGGYGGALVYISFAIMSYGILPRKKEKKVRTTESKKGQEKSKDSSKKSKEVKKE